MIDQMRPSFSGAIRDFRSESSAIIADLVSGSKRPQPAISGSVRKQPRHKPLAPSTMQTFTHGVATDWEVSFDIRER